MQQKTFSLPQIPSYDSLSGEILSAERINLSIQPEPRDEKRESPDSAITDREESLLDDLNFDITNYIAKFKDQLLDIEKIILKQFPLKSFAEVKDFYDLLDDYIIKLSATNQAEDLSDLSDSDSDYEQLSSPKLLAPKKSLKIITLEIFKDTIELFFESCDKQNHDIKIHEFSTKFTRIFNILRLKTGAFSAKTLKNLSDLILQTIQQTLSEIDLYKKTTGLMLFPENFINTLSKINTDDIAAMLIYSKIKPKLSQSIFKQNILQYLDEIKITLNTLDMSIAKVNLYSVIAEFDNILLCPEEDIVQINHPWTLKIDPTIFPNEHEILNQINELYDQLQIQSQRITLINNFLAQIDQDCSTSSEPKLAKALLSDRSRLKSKSSELIHMFEYFTKF